MKKMRSVFDYKKITGKINLMALVILMAFAILLLVFYTQNSSMLTSLKTIQDLRVPFPIVTSDLVSGANRVAASQRAFLMTGEDRFRRYLADSDGAFHDRTGAFGTLAGFTEKTRYGARCP